MDGDARSPSLIKEKKMTVAPPVSKVAPVKTNAKKIKFLRDKYREKVRGIFRFHEVPGGTLSFCYKEFAEDPVEKFTMVDGLQYQIPLGVAKHLNKNGWYPRHKHAVDQNGIPMVDIGQKVRRFSFQSLEFVDTEDLTPDGDAV